MKIVYGHQIFTRQVFGGISRYIYELSQRLPGLAGDSAEVFAPLHVNAYLGEAACKSRVRLPKFRGGAAALGTINIALGKARLQPRTDIDISHSSYFPLIDYAPRGSQRVVTVYDMIHEKYPASFAKHDLTPRFKRRAVAAADHVICISESTRRDLIEITGVSVEKTSVIHLGHALTVTDRGGTALPPKLDRPFLLYVGNRRGYKNFDAVLLALSRSLALRNGFTLVCFGGGKPDRNEQEMIHKLGFSTEQVLHYEGSDALLSSLYARAAAFIYPSLYEGFGIPPLEAMAHGCPVACSNSSSLPEVVGQSAELFDPTDPDAISRAIESVIGSSVRRQQLVNSGYERIKCFSWDKCARETLTAYKMLLGDPR